MDAKERQFQSAITKFETQEFRDAIFSFIDLHQQGYRQKEIFEILNEACYAENEAEMRENYRSNLELFKDYPFVLGGEFCDFDELPFRLYFVNESEFYLFDLNAGRFDQLYCCSDGTEFDLHHASFDAPLLLEHELNESHLTFLNDNLRKSEDIACDNHIYLFYESFTELAKLLLVRKLDRLLADQKFVFLFGTENRRYPLDFKTEFGIDYSRMQSKELSVGQIKRMIFGWKIANASGTSFLADIMDFHPELLTIPDCVMYSFADLYRGQLQGKTRSEAISFLKRLPDSDERKAGIVNLVRNNSTTLSKALRAEFNRVTVEQFLAVLESVLAEYPNPTAREWLIGMFLAYSRCHGRQFGRVIPALFLYPHDDIFYLAGFARDGLKFYFDLVESFPYHKVIAVIRDPVTQAGSVINFMTRGHPSARNVQGEVQLDPFYCVTFGSILPKDYYFPLNHQLRADIRVVRFEDLKLNPEATFASMTEFLNISVAPSMFHTTWCGLTRVGINTENAVFEGFDPAPVYKSYDQYLSVFDKYRLELLLWRRLESYGYQAKYYDGQQFSDEDVIRMMELPFLCESIKTVIPAQEKRSARATGMQFIRFAASIKSFPFSVNGGEEQFAPLPWLRPKEELLKQPLYR